MNPLDQDQKTLDLFKPLDREAEARAQFLDSSILMQKIDILESNTSVFYRFVAWSQLFFSSSAVAAAGAALLVTVFLARVDVSPPVRTHAEAVMEPGSGMAAIPKEAQERMVKGAAKETVVEEATNIVGLPSKAAPEIQPELDNVDIEKRLLVQPVGRETLHNLPLPRPLGIGPKGGPSRAASGRQPDGPDAETRPKEQDVPKPVPALKILNNILDLRRGEESRIIVSASGRVKVTILDRRGRLVLQLFDGTVSGEKQIPWQGRDASGRPLSAGIYLVVAEGDSWSDSAKVVVKK